MKQTIPERVKRQAMSAIGHFETTALIRQMTAQYHGPSASDSQSILLERPCQQLTDEVKCKARNAVSHPEVRAYVRLLDETGTILPPHVPTLAAQPIGKRIEAMYRSGLSPDIIHPVVTKDNFEKDLCLTR